MNINNNRSINNNILNKKLKRISVSFTQEEYNIIHSKASSNHQSDSAYVRNIVLNKWNPVISPKAYARLSNQMQYIATTYKDVPGLCDHLDRLYSHLQSCIMEV